jgi:hypothetical protein
MKSRVPLFATLGLCLLLGAPGASLAFGDGTPDESPPAEETVCEDAGLRGAAYGLCVAYCEANDCDAFPDSEACDKLWANYTKITGEQFFPCEDEDGS